MSTKPGAITVVKPFRAEAIILSGPALKTVHDLGVDVPPSEFLKNAGKIRPDIIGLSGLLTSSYDSMSATIRLLLASPETSISKTPIVIGGNQLNEQVCEYFGADGLVTDAMTGVRLCQRLMAERANQYFPNSM